MSSEAALTSFSAVEALSAVESGRISCLELLDAHLARIADVDPTVQAFVTVEQESARAVARERDRESGQGRRRGPLHGLPFVAKDLIATAGVRTSAGSPVLADWVPDRSATVIDRIIAAGGILLGKVSTPEFAIDVTPERTVNPWDTGRTPGGSSSGSGAALAARLAPAALGTDTGGSVRIPAALCGVVGLKPTYGRVSRNGVIPVSWSLDHVGPMARTAEDVALLFDAIAGHDPRDVTSVRMPPPTTRAELDGSLAGLRIGIPEAFFFEDIEPSVRAAVDEAVLVLQSAGAVRVAVSVEHVERSAGLGDAVGMPEMTLSHRRWVRERPGDYSQAARAALVHGELQLACDYLEAQRGRMQLTSAYERALEHADVLLTPTTATTASPLTQALIPVGRRDAEPPTAVFTRLTYPANVAGIPALSVPCGFDGAGLPIGLQIMGRPFEEGLLLRTAHVYQQETDWHRRVPDLPATGVTGSHGVTGSEIRT